MATPGAVGLAPPLLHGKAERLATVVKIATEVAGPVAADVDGQARFPREAVEALRRARLLGAFVPEELGGAGASVSELAASCTALAQHCASAAMVLAMHHIQVACLVRHGQGAFFRRYLEIVAERQLLIASATSEVGVGGDLRSSLAAIERADDGICALTKECSTLSYGAHADAILATARRAPSAARGDQVLVLLPKEDCALTAKGAWDTLGLRGTCSPAFQLVAAFGEQQILAEPFADIAPVTMVPFSHILWASCWLGIATDAVARARGTVQSAARKQPGTTPPTALRLAEVTARLHTMRAHVHELCRDYEDLLAAGEAGRDTLLSVGFALRLNTLKVVASELVVEIVSQALAIGGIAAYRNDSPVSLGRHLRDAHSASLMIGNDRIHATNAALLLVAKGD